MKKTILKNKILQKLYKPQKSKYINVDNVKSFDEMEKFLNKKISGLKGGKKDDDKGDEKKKDS